MNLLQILGSKLMVLAHVLSFLLPIMSAVDSDCNYYQQMELGATYYVYNKEYPNYYGRNKNCLWKTVAPQGYTIEATCQFEMPNGSCVDDQVLISPTGQDDLGNAHVFCGFGNTTVQSEANTLTIGLRTSWQTTGGRFLCSLYAKYTPPAQCDCGWKNMRRIVGGVETKVNEFPMMAALIDVQLKDLFCGATIIANRYVLTAAHCLEKKTVANTAVLTGDHDITTGTETNATAIQYSSNFIIHPNYDADRKLFDIALVKTQTIIKYNWGVGPACLPFTYYTQSFAGTTVNAVGWGTTEFTGPASNYLQKTDLNVLDYQDCYNKVNGTVDQLCTYYPGHDACQKDSGGPIIWFDPSSYRAFVIGVVSYGYGCANERPAINTRVTSYLMWIMSNTADADYCIKGAN